VEELHFQLWRAEVRNFLASSALFWLATYHIDALRVDGVASMLYLDYARDAGEWIPNRFGGRENLEAVEFLKQLNLAAYRDHPDSQTIAEESTPGRWCRVRPTSAVWASASNGTWAGCTTSSSTSSRIP